MLKLNEWGALVQSPGIETIEFGFLRTPGMVIATAAELKAAGLVPAAELAALKAQLAGLPRYIHSAGRIWAAAIDGEAGYPQYIRAADLDAVLKENSD